MKKHLPKLLLLPILVLTSCGSGLSVRIYRGNHLTQRLERKVVDKNGRTGIQSVPSDSPRFSEFQAVHDSEMAKINKAINRCLSAGVKLDDL